MTRRNPSLSLACLLSFALGAAVAVMHPDGAAAQSGRTIQISATCLTGQTSAADPAVEVTIENDADLRVYVPYAGAFPSAQAIGPGGFPGLVQEAPERTTVETVADGDTLTIEVPWVGARIRQGDIEVAVVVTSAGVALPSCGDARPTTLTLPAQTPRTSGEEGAESATIAAETIGQLESGLAYPALYALLHPDAQTLIPFEGVACWYAERFGPPVERETDVICSTRVDDVTFVEWTWGGNGETYSPTAEIVYTQEIGPSPAGGEPVQATEHLVRENGFWRWFFGGSPEALSGQTTECGLFS